MTRFRPCIDLHEGKVKQIVGGTLGSDSNQLKENFVSENSAAYYAEMYANDNLKGGHVIKLGPRNNEAAREALAAFPEGLQLGGGVHSDNAASWIEAGASHVIATSFLFDEYGKWLPSNLDQLVSKVGRKRLVIDLSCRKTKGGWTVAMNKWQTLTDLPLNHKTLDDLTGRCDEFLIHSADIEGKCKGIDRNLVKMLGEWNKDKNKPMTYAGGAKSIADLKLVDKLSHGTIDLTIGSALDIFGGKGASYADCVAYNEALEEK